RDPVQVHEPEAIARERIAQSLHDLVSLGSNADHIEWRAATSPQAAPLADGEACVAIVLSDLVARRVDGGAGDERWMVGTETCGQEAGVVAVRNEADLLRLRLVGGDQTERARPLAHLRLREVADREAKVRRDVGRHTPE